MPSKFLLIKSFLAIVVASSFNYILVLNDHPIASPVLEQVYADSTCQLTGIAVARSGRIFTNYPFWSDRYKNAVVEIKSGNRTVPFPNQEMNSWHPGENGIDKWVCVQAVYVDPQDYLWVVDPASPKQKGVYQNSQKLAKIDLSSNNVIRTYPLAGVTDDQSYINDVRVDVASQTAYLTNSSEGGLIVVDLNSGKARQVLQGTTYVVADPNYNFAIDGTPVTKNGVPFHSNSDGIALTPDGQYLYFKPLTDDRLFRVKTAFLRDTSIQGGVLASKVETLGHFKTTDGMAIDDKGNLYLGDLENHQLLKIDGTLKMTTFLADKRLIWPDSYQITPDGYLYVSCSQIEKQPEYNNGINKRTTPYAIYRVKL
jgi:sugar lactone lactonase YvrE